MLEKLESLKEINSTLEAENRLLKAQVQAQTARTDFLEDCLAEIGGMVYS